ncbi:MAG TPA: ATP-grasp domain-containing protein, partial [Bryobacteraceae bacterium]|nr:ATP-grasp domain-containing protein [Bryobacteraceae bacterium]
YQIRVFEQAARRLGVEPTLASDHCDRLEDPWGDRAIAVKFDYRLPQSVNTFRGMQFDGVAAVGDRPAVLAAEVAEMLGVPFHPPAAARACQDKYLARQLYQAAGLPVPAYFRAGLQEDAGELARRAPYPCVLKPVGLSASRGVIRANDEPEFVAAFGRIRKLLEKTPDVRRLRQLSLQVESYIEGREFAVEGIVTHGKFRALAIFDKPDPLTGPFFEETLYVTPSRESAAVQRALLDAAASAVRALGLYHGPAHLEMRWNEDGVWMLDAAARPIGGLCARALRFEAEEGGRTHEQRGYPGPPYLPLEELIIRHALGEDLSAARLQGPASGVMMIPIPHGGIYQSVSGIEKAQAVAGIEDVVITATEGQRLLPLPEGASYLGFIFARGDSPATVENALRRAHTELRFRIATALETLSPST